MASFQKLPFLFGIQLMITNNILKILHCVRQLASLACQIPILA